MDVFPTTVVPGSERAFVHKRIFGAAKGFLSGGVVGAASGFATGGSSGSSVPTRSTVPGGPSRDFTDLTGGAGPCRTGLIRNQSGRCVAPSGGLGGIIRRAVPGGSEGLEMSGVPGTRTIVRRVCPRGSVLGIDGNCHNKRAIRNADRWWPAPRKPLMTGGDLNAIATAARAARRLETAKKRLEKMGMIKKPRKPITVAQAKKVLHHQQTS